MQRIGISAEFVRPDRVGGAEHALKNLLSGFAQVLPTSDQLVVIADFHWDIPGGERFDWIRPPRPSRNRFAQEHFTYQAVGDTLDAMLYPSYATPPGRKRCRLVTVIQDLEHIRIPQFIPYAKQLWLHYAHRHTLHRADVTVLPSRFVRQDVLRNYGRKWRDTTAVIPNAVSWSRLDADQPPRPLADAYVLCVAAHYPNKNLDTLVRSFAQVRGDRPDLKLALVGQRYDELLGVRNGCDIALLVHELGLADSVVITGYVDDKEVGAYYRHATLVVYPSLFEGFGLPPVEALGFGMPVLTSRCTSIPEVAGDLAVYLNDPLDVSELADKMRMILDRPGDFRPSPVQSAAVRRRFDPARVARRYYAVLTENEAHFSADRRRLQAT